MRTRPPSNFLDVLYGSRMALLALGVVSCSTPDRPAALGSDDALTTIDGRPALEQLLGHTVVGDELYFVNRAPHPNAPLERMIEVGSIDGDGHARVLARTSDLWVRGMPEAHDGWLYVPFELSNTGGGGLNRMRTTAPDQHLYRVYGAGGISLSFARPGELVSCGSVLYSRSGTLEAFDGSQIVTLATSQPGDVLADYDARCIAGTLHMWRAGGTVIRRYRDGVAIADLAVPSGRPLPFVLNAQLHVSLADLAASPDDVRDVLGEANGRFYFATRSDGLWSTDGTVGGTARVADLPGRIAERPVFDGERFLVHVVAGDQHRVVAFAPSTLSATTLPDAAPQSAAGGFVRSGDRVVYCDGNAKIHTLFADGSPSTTAEECSSIVAAIGRTVLYRRTAASATVSTWTAAE